MLGKWTCYNQAYTQGAVQYGNDDAYTGIIDCPIPYFTWSLAMRHCCASKATI